jgi:predicted adenine nucleotide alpha hydrolase (AANH) superfamily ATPase/ribonuclease HII
MIVFALEICYIMQLYDQLNLPPLIIYMDEAGRWPLAWPVSVGSIIKHKSADYTIFGDSKKIKPLVRLELMVALKKFCDGHKLSYGYAQSSAHEIDQYGIIIAIQMASVRSIYDLLCRYYKNILYSQLSNSVRWDDHLFMIQIEQLLHKWCQSDGSKYYFIKTFITLTQKQFFWKWLIWDGNHSFWLDALLDCQVQTIVRGDAKNHLIWAASIVAKVLRDQYMTDAHMLYPKRSFDSHKWYGTLTHRVQIQKYIDQKKRLTPQHRHTYLSQFNTNITTSRSRKLYTHIVPKEINNSIQKPKLLLHICCAPDLSWPLHRLKHYFKLYLFRYNPNIHPKQEHEKRYEQFVKLYNLEWWDYEIVEDRYDPKEFFEAFVTHKKLINPNLVIADRNTVLKEAWSMEERSDRCNPCYLMRLQQASHQAYKLGIRYFTSTLLISPKKVANKLFQYGLQAQEKNNNTKFLRFDFAKKEGYKKASELTKQYDLYRQNYCWCGRTIPKPWEHKKWYAWW